MAEPPIRIIKGKRVSTRKKRPTGSTWRLVFIPHGEGELLCVERDTMLPIRLRRAVECTVEEEAAGYEPVYDR
jgi:hypothetical protein